jgi:hypothetical protein
VTHYLIWCVTDGETEVNAPDVVASSMVEACETAGDERYRDNPYNNPITYGIKEYGGNVFEYQVRAEPSISMTATMTKDGDKPKEAR